MVACAAGVARAPSNERVYAMRICPFFYWAGKVGV
jgi:hypothetical protein